MDLARGTQRSTKRDPGEPAVRSGAMSPGRPAHGPARTLAALLVAALVFLTGLDQGPSYVFTLAYGQASRPNVFVYLHTESKFARLEKTLKEKLPGLEITVFGRFRDLEDALQTRPPDAVITSNALIVSQGFPIALQGERGGADWEPYVLLSQGRALAGSLSGKVIGVVDLLGRSGTQEFVEKLLGTAEIKLKRVTKLEDLLPLLQFSAADAVLVPSASVKDVSERSRLVLSVLALPDARVKLPAVGVLNASVRASVISQIRALDSETTRSLGLESWRAP
jgi:hypothetical protein